MADLKHSQDTHVNRASQERSPDLSALSLNTPEHLRESPLTPPRHTHESVREKWAQRSLSTGASIEGRRVGGAR